MMTLIEAVAKANAELGATADSIALLKRAQEFIEKDEVENALGGNAAALRHLLLRVAREADEGRDYPIVSLADGVFKSQADAVEHQRALRLAGIVYRALGEVAK